MSKYDGKFKIGDKFNEWTIIDNVPKLSKLKCRCSCGNERNVQITILLTGRYKSCGCYKDKGLIGKKFNKLTVLRKLNTKRYGCWEYECLCECGNKKILTSYDVRAGRYKSCGCENFLKGKKHKDWIGYGDISGTIYSVIRLRAKNKKLKFTVSIEYLWNLYLKQDKKCALSGLDISFENKECSLDRIDSKKGYIEGNVQWLHKDVNIMKNGYSNNYFIFISKRISDNNKNFEFLDDNTYKFGENKRKE